MVNLLPWRARRRERARKRLLFSLGICAISSLALVLLLERGLHGRIHSQQLANQRLAAEIRVLAARDAEVQQLRREQQDVARHMRVLNGLRRSRTLPPEILAELALGLPEAVHFRQLTRAGGELRIAGFAQSQAAVAELLRRLSVAALFSEAQLTEVAGAAPETAAPGWFEFALLLRIADTGD